MLTAKDAKNVSQKAANELIPPLMEETLKFVNECAEKGHTQCSKIVAEKPLFIIQEFVKSLKKLGYKAEFNHHLYLQSPTVDISW